MPTRTKPAPESQMADVVRTTREQALAALKQSQDFALESTAGWMNLLGRMTPANPGLPSVPDLGEVWSESFDFVKDLAAAQTNFASTWMSTLVPAASSAVSGS